ncbi:copper transporter [Streptosporangium sandarakinum]|uniref:copper transporter n=1 Tax=Streptosporangium TaxID=2000 RepID=UPI0031F77B9E
MIDFRYHLVSIVAIFLALSVGIVLGTSFLEDPAIKATEIFANQLRVSNEDYRDQLEAVQKREAANDAFVTDAAPRLVQNALATESVVIVEAPGVTNAVREGVQDLLVKAGATVTGRVVLDESYVDAAQAPLIEKLADEAKPADMTFPADATPYRKVATALADAIVTDDPAQIGKENPVAAGVLDAFEAGGLLTVTGEPAKRAALAVLIAPAEPYAGEGAAQQANALVSMALGLDETGRGVVVAGGPSSATTGGVVAALRDDTAAAEKVSTVDNADKPMGRVVVVYALREQLSGATGQYGIGPGVSGVEPSASPAPTATSGG